jgi:hypothetical protein
MRTPAVTTALVFAGCARSAPGTRGPISKDELEEKLCEQFEEEEHQRFGEHGFETTVTEVAKLAAALGIADLAGFTP